MAHNLHFNAGRNQYSHFSLQAKALHGLGTIVDQYPNSELALKYAKLDFVVAKRPNFHKLDGGKAVVYPNSFFIYRTDKEISSVPSWAETMKSYRIPTHSLSSMP